MRPLAALERFLERIFERPTARLLGARLEPVTLVRRVERAIDEERRVAADGMLAPTRLAVLLSPSDAAALAGLATLEADLATAALEHARRRGYRIPERPTVAVVGDPSVTPGEVRVTVAFAEGRGPAAEPALQRDRTLVHPVPPAVRPGTILRVVPPGGAPRTVPLDGRPLTIGRGSDADVVVADPLVSRRHARLAQRAGRLVLTDLGSTNGTRVNDGVVKEAVVAAGDRIQLGATRLEIVAPDTTGPA